MPFIPHTKQDVKQMLDAIGASSIEELFDEIPKDLRCAPLDNIPKGMSEMELARHTEEVQKSVTNGDCYIGAGAYEHHIPACVWELASRGEFLTAYTPYQAEASQGTLQLLYEFQTIMAGLTGMEVSNASLYDGASALAEAVLMAVRVNKKSKSKRILVLGAVHPHYITTTETIVQNQSVELINVAFDKSRGIANTDTLLPYEQEDITAIVVQQPNFFGCLEEVDKLTDWAHQRGALVIASVNPTALALLKPPGEWGESGADIVCGEGQPLGVPMASGGPYFGFLTTRLSYVRQMPGRLIGRTVDKDGEEGFSLTLQAREQHIRRSKATSNICTNQGLLVTAATIYTSLLGFEGLQAVAKKSHLNTQYLINQLEKLPGVSRIHRGGYFHEIALKVSKPAKQVVAMMHEKGIACGLSLGSYYQDMDDTLLVCVTETKSKEMMDDYVNALKGTLETLQ